MSSSLDSLSLGNVVQGLGWSGVGCAGASAAFIGILGCASYAIDCAGKSMDKAALYRECGKYGSMALQFSKASVIMGATLAGTFLGVAASVKVIGSCFQKAQGHLMKSSLFSSSIPILTEALSELRSRIVFVHVIKH